MSALEWVRLCLVVIVFGFSLLALFKAPEGNVLWYCAIVATEAGYLVAPFVLLLAIPWSRPQSVGASVLAIAAALFLLSSLVRGMIAAPGIAQRVDAIWPGADDQPLRLTRLIPHRVGPHEVQHANFGGGDGTSLRADVYRGPPRAGPEPLVIVVHGGSWASGDQTQLPDINGWLASRGYVVVAITYRLAPEHPFPAALDDVIAAVAWARSLPGIDPTRTVLFGRSAGGHLALLAATRIPDLRGVIAYYAPNDMVWSWNHPTSPWVVNTPKTLGDFLGGTLDQVPDAYRAASPLDFAERLPPTLLVHGSRDELVFIEQSHRLDAALTKAGVPHLLVELPWATHGFDGTLWGPGGQIATWSVERFLANVTQ
jgi:acetyl esterase/lipase